MNEFISDIRAVYFCFSWNLWSSPLRQGEFSIELDFTDFLAVRKYFLFFLSFFLFLFSFLFSIFLLSFVYSSSFKLNFKTLSVCIDTSCMCGLPKSFWKEFGVEEVSSKCEIDRAVVFSFEYDRGKFLRRVFCGEEETMKLVSCFKDAEEAEEFFECFSGKEEGVEQLLLCPDGKRLSELRMDFNRNERRKIGGTCGENSLWKFKNRTIFIMGKTNPQCSSVNLDDIRNIFENTLERKSLSTIIQEQLRLIHRISKSIFNYCL